jgi:hypothetical protein
VRARDERAARDLTPLHPRLTFEGARRLTPDQAQPARADPRMDNIENAIAGRPTTLRCSAGRRRPARWAGSNELISSMVNLMSSRINQSLD